MAMIKSVGGVYEINCECGKKYRIMVRYDEQTVKLIPNIPNRK